MDAHHSNIHGAIESSEAGNCESIIHEVIHAETEIIEMINAVHATLSMFNQEVGLQNLKEFERKKRIDMNRSMNSAIVGVQEIGHVFRSDMHANCGDKECLRMELEYIFDILEADFYYSTTELAHIQNDICPACLANIPMKGTIPKWSKSF